MASHRFEGRLVIAPILHKLTGYLNRVPFDIGQPGGQSVINVRQHMLEGVSEFMEEGCYFIKIHQGRLAVDGGALIAVHISDR